MGKDRLTAFSDGVIAIIITIMVLELKVPHGSSWTALAGVAPNFVSYVLSFVYLAIYWNNHHQRRARRWPDPVGQLPPAVLAFAGPRRDGLDGGKFPGANTDGDLWGRAVVAGHRILPVAEGNPAPARNAFGIGERIGARPQGQGIAGTLFGGNRSGIRQPAAVDRDLRSGCRHVACSRSPDREGFPRTIGLPASI